MNDDSLSDVQKGNTKMALPENRHMHPDYCYACDKIHKGACHQFKASEVKCRCHLNDNSCQVDYSVGINIKSLMAGQGNDSVLAREIWNKAIEAAALHCDEMGEEARISENIRGLKK